MRFMPFLQQGWLVGEPSPYERNSGFFSTLVQQPSGYALFLSSLFPPFWAKWLPFKISLHLGNVLQAWRGKVIWAQYCPLIPSSPVPHNREETGLWCKSHIGLFAETAGIHRALASKFITEEYSIRDITTHMPKSWPDIWSDMDCWLRYSCR